MLHLSPRPDHQHEFETLLAASLPEIDRRAPPRPLHSVPAIVTPAGHLDRAHRGDQVTPHTERGNFCLSELSDIQLTADLTDAATEKLMAKVPIFVEWDEYWQTKPFKKVNWER
jgi:hypothetical protein